MTTAASLGALLQLARKQKRLPKTALAAVAGISRNTLQQLEAGLANVELKTLLAICDALDLELVLSPKELTAKLQPTFRVAERESVYSSNSVGGSGQEERVEGFLSRLVTEREGEAMPQSSPSSQSARRTNKPPKEPS